MHVVHLLMSFAFYWFGIMYVKMAIFFKTITASIDLILQTHIVLTSPFLLTLVNLSIYLVYVL